MSVLSDEDQIIHDVASLRLDDTQDHKDSVEAAYRDLQDRKRREFLVRNSTGVVRLLQKFDNAMHALPKESQIGKAYKTVTSIPTPSLSSVAMLPLDLAFKGAVRLGLMKPLIVATNTKSTQGAAFTSDENNMRGPF